MVTGRRLISCLATRPESAIRRDGAQHSYYVLQLMLAHILAARLIERPPPPQASPSLAVFAAEAITAGG